MNLKQTDRNRTELFKAAHGQECDILIARQGDHYRLLHGQLRLVARLHASNEIAVEVKDEGQVRIVKTRGGLQVVRGSQRLPLRRDE